MLRAPRRASRARFTRYRKCQAVVREGERDAYAEKAAEEEQAGSSE